MGNTMLVRKNPSGHRKQLIVRFFMQPGPGTFMRYIPGILLAEVTPYYSLQFHLTNTCLFDQSMLLSIATGTA